ncbi:DUF2934 domain-containing protein [Thiocapsa sp.]|uniref:DUF2934 domain-containing protein n=1 Tax=Thiocapsa sp. TaxID=2024551 RepID=UPI0025DCCF67|nr:DUF2934 domain-containing protein [Thiocapsa sp.]
MADDKTIVTKKTAPKAAVDSKNPVIKKTVAKKTATKAAAGQNAGLKTAQDKAAPVKPAAIAAKPAPPKTAPAKAAATKKTAPTMAKTAAATTSAKKAPAKKAPERAGTSAPRPAPTALEGKSISLKSLANVSDEERLHMIHEAAYYRAEKRRFAPGHEVEDWAEAEREIDDLIANAKRISGR